MTDGLIFRLLFVGSMVVLTVLITLFIVLGKKLATKIKTVKLKKERSEGKDLFSFEPSEDFTTHQAA